MMRYLCISIAFLTLVAGCLKQEPPKEGAMRVALVYEAWGDSTFELQQYEFWQNDLYEGYRWRCVNQCKHKLDIPRMVREYRDNGVREVYPVEQK